MRFDTHVLDIDAEATAQRLADFIRDRIRDPLRRQGAVVGLSGGIDSAVVVSLCVRALGPDRVLGVALPEFESDSQSADLARQLAEDLGIELITEEISGVLEAIGCYDRRNEAIRTVFPEFGEGWTAKITNPGSILDKQTFNFFHLTVTDPQGREHTRRLPSEAYLQIVAASNFKQRVRMTKLYYHAESRHRAVVGTGNRDEFGQGFFVKYGDGGADLHPIFRLYKTQVFALGRHLGVPAGILDRAPTTDTYSAEVSQVEFYYGLDFLRMDLIDWAMEHGVDPARVAGFLDLQPAQVERAMAHIRRKHVATEYLRSVPSELVGTESEASVDPVPLHRARTDPAVSGR